MPRAMEVTAALALATEKITVDAFASDGPDDYLLTTSCNWCSTGAPCTPSAAGPGHSLLDRHGSS